VHTHQVLGPSPGFWAALPWWLLLAVSAGALARGFAWASHGVADVFKRRVPWAPARPFLGGWLIVAAWLGLGLERHAGLGLNLIDQAFDQAMPWWESLLKAGFTAWSVGSGFKGGEVTPLFAMGALLGSAWGAVAPVPVPWLAALGLVAVFAGAARTPVACAVMAVELFGWPVLVPALLVCHLSVRVAGPVGIYKAQAEPLPG
jgi:H+/Cl- antiporter ClcA